MLLQKKPHSKGRSFSAVNTVAPLVLFFIDATKLSSKSKLQAQPSSPTDYNGGQHNKKD